MQFRTLEWVLLQLPISLKSIRVLILEAACIQRLITVVLHQELLLPQEHWDVSIAAVSRFAILNRLIVDGFLIR